MADETRLIGRLLGVGQKANKSGEGSHTKLTIEESNGRSFEWTTFEKGTFADLELNKVYEFEISRPDNPKGKEPYRNVDGLVGPSTFAQATTGQHQAATTPKREQSTMSYGRNERATDIRTALMQANTLATTIYGSSNYMRVDGSLPEPRTFALDVTEIADEFLTWIESQSAENPRSTKQSGQVHNGVGMTVNIPEEGTVSNADTFWRRLRQPDVSKTAEDVAVVIGGSAPDYVRDKLHGEWSRLLDLVFDAWGIRPPP